MDSNRNVAKNPVSDEEKKLLQNFVAREATPEERDSFLVKNYPHLTEKARGVFMEMSATDQFRVIFDGPMKESRDPVEILYGRVKRFLDMELQLRAMSKRSNHDAEKAKKQPSAKMQELSVRIAHSLANPTYEEVPASERRCAGVDQKLEEATKPKILEGSVKGVGGVIEAMQKKYAMVKGERLRVVNETKDLWKLEGEKTVPKCQMNTGWKWVVKGAEDEVKKKQEETARKKEAKRKAEAAKKAEEERERSKGKDAKKDGKTEKSVKRDKEKGREKEKSKEKDKKKADKDSKKAEKKGKSKKRERASSSSEEEESESASRKRSKKKVKVKKSKKRKSSSGSEESPA
ncbi:unnamed protein product [Durusdinium trenchii]|uniref:Uncharacterized protein n=1 Tax=Durusdinium trenchii TaxID=1381693 RepID=A0ABP0L1K8_9DINO